MSYPSYDNEQKLEELRLDEDYMQDDLNKDLLMDYCDKFQSKALFSQRETAFYDISSLGQRNKKYQIVLRTRQKRAIFVLSTRQ